MICPKNPFFTFRSKLTHPKFTGNRGLTLIEILVVVAIVGIMAGVLVVVVNPFQLNAKARDARRVSNLKAIQTALELYKINNGGLYPLSASWSVLTGGDSVSVALVPTSAGVVKYIDNFPQDPSYQSSFSGAVNPCNLDLSGTPAYRYNYRTPNPATSYVLTAQIEVSSSANQNTCQSLNNWSSLAGGCANSNCVGLESKGN